MKKKRKNSKQTRGTGGRSLPRGCFRGTGGERGQQSSSAIVTDGTDGTDDVDGIDAFGLGSSAISSAISLILVSSLLQRPPWSSSLLRGCRALNNLERLLPPLAFSFRSAMSMALGVAGRGSGYRNGSKRNRNTARARRD